MVRGAPPWSLMWTSSFAFILLSSSRDTKVDIKSCWADHSSSSVSWSELAEIVWIIGLHTPGWFWQIQAREGASSKWLCWELWKLVISTGVQTSTVWKTVTAPAGGTEARRWCLATSCDLHYGKSFLLVLGKNIVKEESTSNWGLWCVHS